MKRYIYKGLMLITVLAHSACRKYVEISPEQIRVLKRTSDFQQLLYNSTTFDPAYYLPVLAADDTGNEILSWQNSLSLSQANAFIWAEKTYGQSEEDVDWNNLYKQIYTCNLIEEGIMNSEGGTEALKELVLASARVHRAFAYYTLVNLYAKQYDPLSAESDPGVPLQLSTSFYSSLERASVQKVYEKISEDLKASLTGLPDKPDYSPNPSKAAAYSILSRVYLNMRQFAQAEEYADRTLGIQNTLVDLNDYAANRNTYPAKIRNPEVIFFKRTSQFPTSLAISSSATALYDQVNDLRYTTFYLSDPNIPGGNFPAGNGNKLYYKSRITADGVWVGPTVPELMLIKAECRARADDPSGAVSILNALRKKRYLRVNYSADLSADSRAEALQHVINERGRELVGTGMRWFDQRRLSKDAGLVSPVTRLFKGESYTLEPESNRYTFAIADKYIQLNPEIIQNPR
ncbi:RagB/SusD family nutrient uptake outer membrane protein [Desertivirga xinjiangensis]|uniref:RagB/SusD family nutrient uptake outer membrane protein n=1 Tax=Desertivirga xinjiangensis TaxID=539206 RepID=UPI00210D490F|nr:RagB/SusD family nutrient uptake outer membrane protein [Pedobacter xinjiangensis]